MSERHFVSPEKAESPLAFADWDSRYVRPTWSLLDEGRRELTIRRGALEGVGAALDRARDEKLRRGDALFKRLFYKDYEYAHWWRRRETPTIFDFQLLKDPHGLRASLASEVEQKFWNHEWPTAPDAEVRDAKSRVSFLHHSFVASVGTVELLADPSGKRVPGPVATLTLGAGHIAVTWFRQVNDHENDYLRSRAERYNDLAGAIYSTTTPI
tara:strand:- start:8541 stop:9176 length:636 start_codon:yes stop_codon:yes gene_type:complete